LNEIGKHRDQPRPAMLGRADDFENLKHL
jgi:hypothetical protein